MCMYTCMYMYTRLHICSRSYHINASLYTRFLRGRDPSPRKGASLRRHEFPSDNDNSNSNNNSNTNNNK